MNIENSTRLWHVVNRFISAIFCVGLIAFWATGATAQKTAAREIVVNTEPKATVWLNDILRGKTDDGGKLTIKPVAAGAHKIRVRADGFKETTQAITAAQKGDVTIQLTATTDKAELAFQEAERLTTSDREKAVAAYRAAIAARPKYPEAQLGLARVLLAMNNFDEALNAVKEARKARPAYAEASAIEGRIYVEESDEAKAIAAFKRAIVEGKNFQPEAQTGLGLLYKTKAEIAAGEGDYEAEEANYLLAANHFKKAIAQLGGAPDAITIYQFLGLAYEKMKKPAEAIAVYEEFLKVFPDANEATAVRSFIVQLKKEMSGEQE